MVGYACNGLGGFWDVISGIGQQWSTTLSDIAKAKYSVPSVEGTYIKQTQGETIQVATSPYTSSLIASPIGTSGLVPIIALGLGAYVLVKAMK